MVQEFRRDAEGVAADNSQERESHARLAEAAWSKVGVERVADQNVHGGRNSPWGPQPETKPASGAGSSDGRRSPWANPDEKAPQGGGNDSTIPSWITNAGKPGAPVKPGDQKPAEPAKPAKPADPARPAEAVKPVEPTKPAGPALPGPPRDGKAPETIPVPPIPWNHQPKEPRPWTPPSLPPFHTNPGDPPKTKPGSDRLPPFEPIPLPNIDEGKSKVYEHMRLDNRAADHNTPDAVVRIPPDFDPSKPINLVIYNHGWGSTARSAYHDNKLDEQLRNAPKNTVLIVPEWQRTAGASNGDQGRFKNENLFRNMVTEIFSKTDVLRGKGWNDVANVDIFSHSAGYGPSETMIYKNGIGDKVRSITLLDSNYDETGFDSWLQSNIHDLASGKKQFYNIFSGTAGESKRQASRVQDMLTRAGYSSSLAKLDYNNPKTMLDATTFANNSILFKLSTATAGNDGPHGSTPKLWIAPIEAAARLRAGQPMRSLR